MYLVAFHQWRSDTEFILCSVLTASACRGDCYVHYMSVLVHITQTIMAFILKASLRSGNAKSLYRGQLDGFIRVFHIGVGAEGWRASLRHAQTTGARFDRALWQ